MTVTCPECGAKLLAEYTFVDSATCPYVRKYVGYSTYCYISPSQGKVWTFSKGNGSQEAYVGHITDGTRLTTYTVHYKYDPG